MRRHIAVMLLPLIALASGRSWAAGGHSAGFVENRGQVNGAVKFYLPGSRADIYLTSRAVVFDLKESARRGDAVYVRFHGSKEAPSISGRGELPARFSFFRGKDPAAWRSGVRVFEEILCHDMWPGIDLVFRQEDGGLAYEAIIRPGGDPARIAFTVEGGSIVHERTGLSGKFSWTPSQREEGGSSATSSGLLWSSFIGGTGYDLGRALAIDSLGNVVVAGQTTSSDFPTTPGAYETTYVGGVCDVFVAKLSSSGTSLLWGSFIGGSTEDYGLGLGVDGTGKVLVTGYTHSPDFPTTAAAYDTSFNGGVGDVFVAKLSSDGDSLLWSTFLGGSNRDEGNALALDPSGNAVVTGWTKSTDFSTTPGAYDTSYNGGYHDGDGYVAKLSASGSALLWSTYLGGNTDDYGYGIALDGSRNVVITGVTDGPTFPVTFGAFDLSYNGGYEAFVAKLSAAGNTLLWSTYFGRPGNDFGRAVALDASRNVIVGGYTTSPDFPTTPGAYDTTFSGGPYDSFVARFSASGSTLVWSTFLGGSDDDHLYALALDSAANPVVTGYTKSSDFPTTPAAYDTSFNGGVADAFVSRLASSGNALVESSYLGGGNDDRSYALVLDASSNAVVVGQTDSFNFPTTPGAYDVSRNGSDDVFVVDLEGTALQTSVPSSPTDATSPGGIGHVEVLPNPSVRGSTVRFTIADHTAVTLRIVDASGRLVRMLRVPYPAPGPGSITWDGRDAERRPVKAGVYLYTLETDHRAMSGKLIVLQ